MFLRGRHMRHRLQSIRVTLTLWYATTIALILTIFGWALYERIKTGTYQEIDLSLRAQKATGKRHPPSACAAKSRAAASRFYWVNGPVKPVICARPSVWCAFYRERERCW